jgi:hypothetical protein
MADPALIAIQRERAAEAKVRTSRSRRAGRDVEGATHRAILRYLRYSLPAGYIVQHTPNGELSAAKGSRSKANGAVAGWPDLAIFGPGLHGASAWFLEVKPPTGKGLRKRDLSEAQADCHDALQQAGFNVRVVRSIDDARKAVGDWGLPSLDMTVPDPTGRLA